jgi:hypothetical protein
LTFIILTISSTFIPEKQSDKLLAIVTGVSVLFLSVLMSKAPQTAGVWQRLSFIISFGWMIYSFKTREL